MNADDMVSVLKGKADVAVNKVKSVIDNDPRKAATYGLLGAITATVTYSLITGNTDTVNDKIENAAGAVSRMAYLHLPEAMMATGILKDAAAAVDYYELIKDSGIVMGGFAGLIGTKDFYRTLDPVSKKILLTGGIAALVLFLSGCVDKSGSNPNPAKTDTPVHTPDATPTAEPTQEPTPTAEPTPVESQHLYDINPGYVKIVLETDENLFGTKIEGSTIERDFSGWETVYNDNENVIFQRETYTPRNFDLYGELPKQANALEAEYGQLVKLTREEVDLNPKGNGQLDTVKIKYEGTQGSFTYESNIPEKGTTRLIEDFLNSK